MSNLLDAILMEVAYQDYLAKSKPQEVGCSRAMFVALGFAAFCEEMCVVLLTTKKLRSLIEKSQATMH